jgi:DHA2 family multidrug resistance protein
MGLLFSPMTSLALGLVPRMKAGQASGLMNVIRQVGGSFGIAIFGTLLTQRQLFHTVRYTETITAQNPAATTLLYQMQHLFASRGDVASLASQKSLTLLNLLVAREAAVVGFSDCFLVAAWICVLGIIPALLLPGRPGSKSIAP